MYKKILFGLAISLSTLILLRGQSPNYTKSLAHQWLDVALEVTANDVDRVGAKPTIQSRSLGIAVNAMYDAWAAYDNKAIGTIFQGKLRRPLKERTLNNKKIAISYAMMIVLKDLYPLDKDYIQKSFEGFKLKVNPNDPYSIKAKEIGEKVGKSILDFRHHDGANQLGDEIGSNGQAYSDYTYYKPVNSYKKIIDNDRWHPIPFLNQKGDTFLVDFLTPQWYRVIPFGLKSPSQFRAPEFPKFGSEELKKEVDEVIMFNSHLTSERKATIEFMRDGPRSTGQSGHWLKFAEMVSIRDKNNLDQDVKLFFTVGMTAMDAFIACWETKRYYDSNRPWGYVRIYYKDQMISGWGGPDKGTLQIPASSWHPYSPANFVTPPFPGYVSGHSTVSGACGKILELFTGSDKFGEVEIRRPGIITETPGDPVSLPLPTFTATADMAGISRVMGGYHIQADNVAGLKMGRDVAHYLWNDVFTKYFDGTYKKTK
ncbi:MAG: vanadium-dependent haloperoxidase [Saprospiraceae bacterium]|nr:vanadium-dependent haloperoxidase [Saprospiraceae bacterium]